MCLFSKSETHFLRLAMKIFMIYFCIKYLKNRIYEKLKILAIIKKNTISLSIYPTFSLCKYILNFPSFKPIYLSMSVFCLSLPIYIYIYIYIYIFYFQNFKYIDLTIDLSIHTHTHAHTRVRARARVRSHLCVCMSSSGSWVENFRLFYDNIY